jgi:hypothetical protein
VALLMVFSNFYKQRMLPEEIFEFFVNNKTEIQDHDINLNLDYVKVLEQEIENVRKSTEESEFYANFQGSGLSQQFILQTRLTMKA